MEEIQTKMRNGCDEKSRQGQNGLNNDRTIQLSDGQEVKPTLVPLVLWSVIHYLYFTSLMVGLIVCMLITMTLESLVNKFQSTVHFIRNQIHTIKKVIFFFIRIIWDLPLALLGLILPDMIPQIISYMCSVPTMILQKGHATWSNSVDLLCKMLETPAQIRTFVLELAKEIAKDTFSVLYARCMMCLLFPFKLTKFLFSLIIEIYKCSSLGGAGLSNDAHGWEKKAK